MARKKTTLEFECIFSITRKGDRFVIENIVDSSEREILTRAELIQLADEIRQLAGEERT